MEPLSLQKSRKEELESSLHLIYTGQARVASEIASDVIHGICKKKSIFRRLRRNVDRAVKILTGNEDLNNFGDLLHKSWLDKVRMSKKVSNFRVQEIYRQGRQAGALGGKLLGAGSSGFMLFFVPLNNRNYFLKKMKTYLRVPFKFENTGSCIQEIESSL